MERMYENVKNEAEEVKFVGHDAEDARLVKSDAGGERLEEVREERFEALLEFISSAGEEEWRGLDYPLVLEKFSIGEDEAEEKMMSLFGMSGYDVVGRLKTGDYMEMSLVGGKYRGCVSNK